MREEAAGGGPGGGSGGDSDPGAGAGPGGAPDEGAARWAAHWAAYHAASSAAIGAAAATAAKARRVEQLALGGGSVAGVQFLLLGLWYLVTDSTRDSYESGVGGASGAVFLCCCGPFVLMGLGVLHGGLFSLLVGSLARRAARRTPLGGAWWAAACGLAVSAAYAWPVALAMGIPYLQACAWVVACGAPPLAVAGLAVLRDLSGVRVMRHTGWALGFGLLAVFGGGIIAAKAGLLNTYQPPRMERAEYVAQWSGVEGVRLELRADGVAVARRLPEARTWVDAEVGYCSGTGTWEFRRKGSSGHKGGAFLRDGVELTLPTCGGTYDWWVAGTHARPELFAVAGEPDGGDVRILRRG
ncbi:hypothetical protein [Streptomyces sp. G-G2]|uniref:hypothetical protein n=1 Tax=Streptomyces sp. G-G2 TaxID=3046201 RepID=UPI0024BB0E15|nr:hypothetical protein [Streptomyces sp. G-G2]MDJ0385661.1 hypothetical protein [Streptomyces sp. G-G2]